MSDVIIFLSILITKNFIHPYHKNRQHKNPCWRRYSFVKLIYPTLMQSYLSELMTRFIISTGVQPTQDIS